MFAIRTEPLGQLFALVCHIIIAGVPNAKRIVRFVQLKCVFASFARSPANRFPTHTNAHTVTLQIARARPNATLRLRLRLPACIPNPYTHTHTHSHLRRAFVERVNAHAHIGACLCVRRKFLACARRHSGDLSVNVRSSGKDVRALNSVVVCVDCGRGERVILRGVSRGVARACAPPNSANRCVRVVVVVVAVHARHQRISVLGPRPRR